MTNVVATQGKLAQYYGTLATYCGLATGNPGNNATPANEASGGSYARVAVGTWTLSTNTVSASAILINAPIGTYTYGLLASAATGATMVDNAAITSTPLNAPGQIVITPSFSVS